MYSPYRSVLLFALVLPLAVVLPLVGCSADQRVQQAAEQRVLRVCSDPNNLPYSDRSGAGFENKIAEVLASDMHAKLEYTWWPQRRGYVGNTLDSCKCDVLIGVPRVAERTLNTSSYYRSTYCFVYRKDRGIHLSSFDDPALRRLRIGVQMVGGDYTNTPPVLALSRRKIVSNVRGYTVFGNYANPEPGMEVLRALDRGEIDVAIVWGPHAGYYAKHSENPLEVVPVSPRIDLPYMPLIYDISMGVRRKDDTLRNELESILARKRPVIDSILRAYGVPLVSDGPIANTIDGTNSDDDDKD